MEKELEIHHGELCKDLGLKNPKLIASSNEESRPGYTKIKANEFMDDKDALK